MTDMIALSEQTGTLERTLDALAVHYERQRRMRSEISRALVLPLALFVVMLAVVVLMLTQVLPVFERVYAQLGLRMTGLGQSLMRLGAVLADAGLGIVIVLAVVIAAALVVAVVPGLRTAFLTWFRRNFGGRGIMGAVLTSRFASAMAMASASGLTMEECVELSAKLCSGSKQMDEKMERCRTELADGARASDALAHAGLFSARDSRLLMLAERTGTLPETLASIARRSEKNTLERIDRLVGSVEPAIVLLAALITGVILLSVMLPLQSIMSTLG
jgi:type IV pilus assembly protein PilC